PYTTLFRSSPVQRLERAGAIRLLPSRRENRTVLPVRDDRLFPRRQPDRRILHVGGGERRVGVVRRRREPARERHQPLAGLVQHVLLLPVEILDGEAV